MDGVRSVRTRGRNGVRMSFFSRCTHMPSTSLLLGNNSLKNAWDSTSFVPGCPQRPCVHEYSGGLALVTSISSNQTCTHQDHDSWPMPNSSHPQLHLFLRCRVSYPGPHRAVAAPDLCGQVVGRVSVGSAHIEQPSTASGPLE